MSRAFLLDLLERVAVTFAGAFAAALLAPLLAGSISISILGSAGIAGLAAVASLIKGLAASQVGSSSSPALLPARLDPEASKPVAPQVVRRVIDETVVEGKRLGRVIEHDARSLMHQLPKSDPPTQAIEWPRRVPILDQGNLGSCCGNATVGALGTQPNYAALSVLLAAGLTLDEAEAVLIYSAAEIADGGKGLPGEDVGTSGLSVAKVAKAKGYVAGYLHCTSIAACFTAIKTGPFIVGTNWMDSFDTPSAAGVVTIAPKAQVRGGHEYLCRGYDPATDLWRFDNSWGDWGLAGSFFYSTATFTALLAAQGDATVLLPLGNAPAPVPPKPTPTPVPAGPFLEVTDAALVAHIDALAAKRGQNPDDYLTARLRSLWKLP